MSGDELWVLLISLAVAGVMWARWYASVLTVTPLAADTAARLPATATPVACAAVLLAVLTSWASHDVRDDLAYILLYVALGAAWVGLATRLFPYLRLSARDDLVERRNAAAGPALSGALLGVTLCYAGSNIGDGPGWWVVVFTGGLATAGFFAAWWLLESLSGAGESVAVERDVAAGLRLGAVLTAVGLILGRAAAGDWQNVAATTADFARVGWPVVPLVGLASGAERVLRASAAQPAPRVLTSGVPVALLYLAGAAGWVWSVGPWS